MLAEAGEARVSPSEPRVAVIVALGVERRCLRGVGPRVALEQSGPGEARAAGAAARALAGGARALVSFGLAGGLAADAAPGRLLLPRHVVTHDARRFSVEPRWHARLAAALAAADIDVDERPLLAAAGVLTSADAKRAAGELGAAAVDLESGAIAAAAERAAVPFAVIRAVADGLDDELPAGVSGWVGPDGETRIAPVLAAALRPGSWGPLWTLARRYASARRSLERAARSLSQEDFLFA